MNKTDLITALAAQNNLTRTAASDIVDSLFNTTDGIIVNAARTDGFNLTGFGSFTVADRSARTARNPKTGAIITVSAKRAPKFTAGKAFREAVNQ